ncbi:MAG: sodium:proton antiporter, partial [Eubacterium sp.]|nr:sodium:proton antiporter [Eubacterium sp.]
MKKRTKKEVKFHHALITVILMIFFMFTALVVFKADPQVPLIFGCLAAGLMAAWLGFSWEEILNSMLKGIGNSLEAILILLLIGVLVGSWIASGTVPSMIYYGLKLISPAIFLPATMIICTLVAFAIGSWGTVGTVGIAFMGIGAAMQIPVPLVAGAVISGSYMGEALSPLSDATNLCAAVVNENVFDIVKKILKPALVVCVAVIIVYAVIGSKYASADAAAIREGVDPILNGISAQFKVTPLALLPLAVMIVFVLLKVPAIPAMLAGGICGMIEAVLLQGKSIGEVLNFGLTGYISESGNSIIDSLLSAGGLLSMMNSISIIIIAMAFGGIMQHTGQMAALIRPLVSRVRT